MFTLGFGGKLFPYHSLNILSDAFELDANVVNFCIMGKLE